MTRAWVLSDMVPWYLPWSDLLKKKVCRYLLQRYLGQFLEEKLRLEQLNVELYNGRGTVSNVSLYPEVSHCKAHSHLVAAAS